MRNQLLIPKPIADFVKAVNERDTHAFLSVFSENAVIADEGDKYQGVDAIKEWNAEKNIGANITLGLIGVSERDGKTILTAEVDGDFDKSGLPVPFLMDLHFTHDENLISLLQYRLVGK